MEVPMDDDDITLQEALDNHGSSPKSLVQDVLPIIRDVASLDWILDHMPEQLRAEVARHLFERYGEHNGPADAFDWGMRMAIWNDAAARQRHHDAWVAHARHVAIPAIRRWLAEHPEVT
jgi:hypothetical protein